MTTYAGVPPQQGTVTFEDYVYHLRFDGVTGGMVANPDAPDPGWSMQENFLGHRSGVCGSSPWMAAKDPAQAPYQLVSDTVVFAAGPANAVTDAGAAWTTNQWVGKTVVAFKAGVLCWMTIASNDATHLSGATGDSWQGAGTPDGSFYIILPYGVGANQLKFADDWQGELRFNGNQVQSGSGPTISKNVQ